MNDDTKSTAPETYEQQQIALQTGELGAEHLRWSLLAERGL